MQNSNVEGTNIPAISSIRVGDKLIDLSTPLVMGIVNITPDSFYDASRLTNEGAILSKVKEMLIHGASIIDVGGYSSRPGAENIDLSTELSRITPAIKSIRSEFPDAIISIDTFRSEVARAGIEAGADIINDISGFSIDHQIVNVAAEYKVPYILMHMRGTPQNMQQQTTYGNIFKEMMLYFSEKIQILKAAGINDIIIDPGFGFSKTIAQSHYILQHLEHFQLLEKPLLIGLSRKAMIYKKLDVSPEEALPGTIALNAVALSKGASILRVHDVKEAVDLIKLMD